MADRDVAEQIRLMKLYLQNIETQIRLGGAICEPAATRRFGGVRTEPRFGAWGANRVHDRGVAGKEGIGRGDLRSAWVRGRETHAQRLRARNGYPRTMATGAQRWSCRRIFLASVAA